MPRFEELQPPLSRAALEALGEMGFSTPTPVQAAAIPRLLRHQDVAVQACTGSGKTLAFLIPTLEILERRAHPLRPQQVGALVIEPTRELAAQVHSVALKLVSHWPALKLELLVGGTDIHADMNRLVQAGGNVVIGTPGRLDDLMTRVREMELRELEVLVLDEADRLLDMGFEATLNSILQRLPKQRRTGLFSATQTKEVLQLVRAGLRNPVRVDVQVVRRAGTDAVDPTTKDASSGKSAALQATPTSLTNFYMLVEEQQRLPQLIKFLNSQLAAGRKLMVYFLTCACVDYYSLVLARLPDLQGAQMRPLHGKMAPKVRSRTYDWFVNLKAGGVLLCTDVAARGLDVPDVDWIVQFDAPQDPNAFVHRVGRTARMGRQGQALLLLRPHEDSYVNFLQMRKVPLQEMEGAEERLPSLRPAMTELLKADRDVMEKGSRAYVSYVRAYKEHQCAYIFQFDKLHLGELATSMALLRLPKLKELGKKRKRGAGGWVDFTPAADVDMDSIRYKDKSREKQRQQNRKAKAAAAAAAAATGEGVSSSDSKKFSRGSDTKKAADPKKSVDARAHGRRRDQLGDEAEMEREVQLMKKLKRGKISKQEFYRLVGESDCEGEDS